MVIHAEEENKRKKDKIRLKMFLTDLNKKSVIEKS